jgi:uncharacterized protein YjbI with pentapeptide repeats
VANQEHVEIIKKGAAEWNAWRGFRPDLTYADLVNTNLTRANLMRANLSGACITKLYCHGR